MDEIKAKLIIEMVGRPAEHMQQAMIGLVDKLGTEKGLKFIDKKVNEPTPVENADGFFTSFAELDINFESITNFFGIIFSYMPAHVEIYEPERFKLEAFNLNEMANYIVTRLHRNEGIMKTLMGEREILIKQLAYIKNGGKIEDLYPKKPEQAQRQIKMEQPVMKEIEKKAAKKEDKKKLTSKKAVKKTDKDK